MQIRPGSIFGHPVSHTSYAVTNLLGHPWEDHKGDQISVNGSSQTYYLPMENKIWDLNVDSVALLSLSATSGSGSEITAHFTQPVNKSPGSTRKSVHAQSPHQSHRHCLSCFPALAWTGHPLLDLGGIAEFLIPCDNDSTLLLFTEQTRESNIH